MIRSLLLAALALLLPMPAFADVTAHYGGGEMAVTIQAADDGSWRVDLAGMAMLIRRDGVDYFVVNLPSSAGKPPVTRLDEFLSLAAPEAIKLDDSADELLDLTPSEGADLAGHKGSGWLFGPHGGTGDDAPILFVMSDAPDLVPVGDVFRHLVGVLAAALKPQLGAKGNLAEQAAVLFGKGTPIRITDKFVLQSVDSAKLDPKLFDLPAPAMPAAEFVAALHPSRPSEITPVPQSKLPSGN